MVMVRALCCHTFARQNLFSPATRPIAVTAAGTWAVVASDDRWIRVYDLEKEPGAVVAEFPACGRVKALALCSKENYIAALESGPRVPASASASSSSDSRPVRAVRIYRNFWLRPPHSPASAEPLPPARNAAQPPTEPLGRVGPRFELLTFSSLHAPTALAASSDAGPGRLAAAVGRSVWVAGYDPRLHYFAFHFTIDLSFSATRLALHESCLAAGSMDEVLVLRIGPDPPRSRFPDEAALPALSKERREAAAAATGGRGSEVLGPTVDLDVAPAAFNGMGRPREPLFIETLLYRRFPASNASRVHTVQLLAKEELCIFVATTFEGFLYQLAGSVRRSAVYAFSERTLQARIGSDFLLHVITSYGLNTYTTRLGRHTCCYPVPDQFPICLVGSLVWREIHMRCLHAWAAGLLLYTEKDNLHTLYSLQFQPIVHLFNDMLQAARTYVNDCVMTSCHLMCEAFQLHSLRDVEIDKDKAVALVEFHMNAMPNLHVDHLRELFAIGKFGLEDILYICAQLKEKDVETKSFLRLYCTSDERFDERVKEASNEVMADFYRLLMEGHREQYIHCVLLRNDRDWFTAHEEAVDASPDAGPPLLLSCLFLFETSCVDEVESMLLRADEEEVRAALLRYPHVLLHQRRLSDFAQFLCVIAPVLTSGVVAELCGDNLPDNLPDCCRLLILEEAFLREKDFLLVPALVDSLTAFLSPVRPPSPTACPHRSFRCRKVAPWVMEQRLEVLNAMPPFHGVSPTEVTMHRPDGACGCALCHSHLLRLQGFLCWATSLPDPSPALDRCLDALAAQEAALAEAVRPGLRFLVAHRASPEAGFRTALAEVPGAQAAALRYLRSQVARLDSAAWRRLAEAEEPGSDLRRRLLRLAVRENEPAAAAAALRGWEAEPEVGALLCARYRSAACEQLFAEGVARLTG